MYKRQDNMVAACNAKSDEEIGLKINDPSPDELGFLARTIDNMVNEIGLLAPVSYTHLDVYKRQASGRR